MFYVAMRNMLTAQTMFMFSFNKRRNNKHLVKATSKILPRYKVMSSGETD